MAVREIILTAQHTDCTFFSTVHIPKRIKEPINMYMDKMYVFIEAFLSNKEDNLI